MFGFVRDLILRLKNERHGDVVRAICSDNGSEFNNSRFKTFCQNGVVERKNRSICEMARMKFDEHRTPRRYSADVVNTACHVGNWIFLRAFLNKMCYELMHGRASSDEDNTSTSTPAAPFTTPAPAAPSSAPPSGPITRARAREFNFVMMLKNEGPKD
jgi:hypothetical protein